MRIRMIMARISRYEIIYDECVTHKTWHSHNDEQTLQENVDKNSYLELLFKKISVSTCSLHAYSLMPNHAHELYSVKNVKEFSMFMRKHHGIFGQSYNKRHQRKGKVANDRPVTTLIRTKAHEIIATLYIHANIFRINIPEPEKFEWSSHRLYAFGERNNYNSKIVLPEWYMGCADSDSGRQKFYQILFDSYLSDPDATSHYIRNSLD